MPVNRLSAKNIVIGLTILLITASTVAAAIISNTSDFDPIRALFGRVSASCFTNSVGANIDTDTVTRETVRTLSVSPDAVNGKVVYQRGNNGSSDIYTITPGSGVSFGLRRGYHPAFSPDGTKIVFVDNTAGATNGFIRLMNADGTNVRNLAHPRQGFSPAWSPDGNRLVFVRGDFDSVGDDGKGGLYVIDMTAGNEGANEVHIPSTMQVSRPSWGVNNRIVFAGLQSLQGGGNQTLGIHITGTIPPSDQITSNPPAITAISGTNTNDRDPAWSYDGTQIAFLSTRDFPMSNASEIYVMDPQGGNVRRVTNASNFKSAPSWAPDGTKIVYSRGGSMGSQNANLAMVNADGSNGTSPTFVTNFGSGDVYPSWGTGSVPSSGVDLSLAVTHKPEPVRQFRPVAFEVTVTNKGTKTATGVGVRFDLAGAEVLAEGIACPLMNKTITCSAPNLAPGGKYVLEFRTKFENSGQFLKSFTAISTETDQTVADNTGTTTVNIQPSPPPVCSPALAGLVTWFSGNNMGGNHQGQFLYRDKILGRLLRRQGATQVFGGKVGDTYYVGGNSSLINEGTNVMNSLPMTISAWVKPYVRSDGTDFPTNTVSNDQPFQNGHGFGLNIWDGGSQLKIDYHDGFRVIPDVKFSHRYYHIAVVYTHGNVKTFVDGELVDNFSFSQGPVNGANKIYIGQHNDDFAGSRNFFYGEIDEIQIYDDSLTEAEVHAIYDADSHGTCDLDRSRDIVFTSQRDPGGGSGSDNSQLFGINADGTGLVNLTIGDSSAYSSPSFTPEGFSVYSAFANSVSSGILGLPVDNAILGAEVMGFGNLNDFEGIRFDSPSASVFGGRIAFSSYAVVQGQIGPRDIVVGDFDSASRNYVLRRLTSGNANDDRPSIQADGSRVVYTSNRNGNYELYMQNVSDASIGPATRLTFNGSIDSRPAFNGDGSKIVFMSERAGDREIFIMDAAPEGPNNRPRQLTFNDAADYDPEFSPDGQWIVFASDRAADDPGIYVMRTDGTQARRLSSNPGNLAPPGPFGKFAEGEPTWGRMTTNPGTPVTPVYSLGGFVDDANGSGLQATLTLSGPVGGTVTSLAGGTYSFNNLPAGSYTVCISPPVGRTFVPTCKTTSLPNPAAGSSGHNYGLHFKATQTMTTTSVGAGVSLRLGNTVVVFDQVNEGGITTFKPIDPPSAEDLLKKGFIDPSISVRIETTAKIVPPVDVCFDVPPHYTADQLNFLRILKKDSVKGEFTFVDRTTQINPVTRTICARVTSFSTTQASGNRAGSMADDTELIGEFLLAEATSIIGFQSANVVVSEGGGQADLIVSRSGDLSAAAMVEYKTAEIGIKGACSTTNGTASSRCDFISVLGTVTFAPGESIKSLNVFIVDDAYAEGNESLNLTMRGASGAAIDLPGSAVISIVDNDSATGPTNPVDDAHFFVRQQYLDLVGVEPTDEEQSLGVDPIIQCGGDQTCRKSKQTDLSHSLFVQFEKRSSFVFRLYRAAYGNTQPLPNPDPTNLTEARKWPAYHVFFDDLARIKAGDGLAQSQLELARDFVSRDQFVQKYSVATFPDGPLFVDAVLNTMKNDTGVDLTAQSNTLVDLYTGAGGTMQGRAAVMYRLAEISQGNPIDNSAFVTAEEGRSFAAGLFFGYLKGDGDLATLSELPTQISAAPNRIVFIGQFINSAEYRSRFGPSAVPPLTLTAQGRVMTSNNRGLSGAEVSIVDPDGVVRSTLTSSAGYFSFADLPSGRSYTVQISSKRYRFSPRTMTLSDNITFEDFVGVE